MLDAKIQTFLEVAAQGSYTRAAERLHLTQPAVTQQIHRLEEHYGHRLVDTCGRVVRLTEAGMLLEHHARMQLANERRFMERMAAEEPPLSLGATLSIADYYLPGPLARALAGGLAPRVTVGNTQVLTGRMLAGELDCALVEGLGLHYQLSKLAAGDVSASMATTYDIELWIPSMNEYKECSSVSNARDYQARRGNMRVRRAGSKKIEFLHTLNGSGLATSRLMPAIVEQFQQADGSVVIPEVLRPFMGGQEKLIPKK